MPSIKTEKTGPANEPLISIVTVCLNSEAHIESAIQSVLNQTYKNIEYLIMDGGSSDSTVDIIARYQSQFDGRMRWISEPDGGIYDAMNRGTKLATGDIIGILNSDDWYFCNTIQAVVDNIEGGIDIYYGDMYLVREVAGKLFKQRRSARTPDQLVSGMCINHPASFLTRDFYKNNGYDTAYEVSADYKFMLEAYLSGAKFKYIQQDMVCMRDGGMSHNNTEGIVGTYRIKKELLGKKDIRLLLRGLMVFWLVRFKGAVSKMLLTESTRNERKTKGWSYLDGEL